jgi:hypothetical protein
MDYIYMGLCPIDVHSERRPHPTAIFGTRRHAMSRIIQKLLERPADLPFASKYTIVGGLIYLSSGALLVVWPGAVQTLLRDPAFVGNEAGLVRAMGMAVMVIGWFYVWGGRTGAQSFPTATIFDRTILVPAVMLPLAAAGVFPHMMIAFAALDVGLGLGALVLIHRSLKKP